MRETVTFKISYDGDALQQGVMSVRDLAPALLALDDLISAAHKEINPTGAALSLKFKSVEKGSFWVTLAAVSEGLSDGLVDLFSSRPAVAIATITTIFGVRGSELGTGLYQLIQKVRGRTPKKVVPISADEVKIDFGDGTTFEVKKEVFSLYKKPAIRKSVYDTLKPLEAEGVDTFKTSIDDKESLSINKGELRYFEAPEVEDEELMDEKSNFNLSIVSLTFKEDNKWRLSDGTNTYNVLISDPIFLKEIEHNNATFSKHDVLQVRMRTRQWRTATGLKTEHEIVKVQKHLKGPKQIDLPLEGDK